MSVGACGVAFININYYSRYPLGIFVKNKFGWDFVRSHLLQLLNLPSKHSSGKLRQHFGVVLIFC